MMINKLPARLFLALAMVGCLSTSSFAIVVADLAGDYQNAANVGDTTADTGLTGRVTGLWNYYSDDDGVIDGDELLLTYVNQVGGTASNGDSGFVGDGTIRFGGLGNFPVVSSGLVFDPVFVPTRIGSVLQVHPGDPAIQDRPILAIEYQVTAGLENVSVNYRLQSGADGNAETDYRIIQIVDGTPSDLVPTTVLGPNTATGVLSASASDLSAGDSIWFFLDSGFTNNVNDAWPAGDATNIGLEVVGDPTDVMTLEVNTATGAVTLKGTPNVGFDLNGYSISSPSGQLLPGNWNSLQDDVPNFGDGVANNLSAWEELGPGIETQVGEFNADGSSLFGLGGTSQVFLGNLFTPGGTEDLELEVSVAGGSIMVGEVEYVSSPGLLGDYNNDGSVDAADYVVWRNNLGGTTLLNEGASPGVVDQEDYTVWKNNFGNTSGSLAGAPSQVPEPSSLLLVALITAAGVCRRTPRAKRVAIVLASVAFIALANSALATRTLDRDYQMGDEPVENATANNDLTFGTFDSTGGSTFQDLSQSGSPRYVDVTARPFPGASELGIEFDGNGEYLFGEQVNGVPGLGYPGSDTFPNPEADYTGITTRGIQMWVRPTASGTGTRQDLIADTYQFGLHITSDDKWAMTWGSLAHSPTGRVYVSDEDVDFGNWSHVQQHSFGETLGVLYVNGEAVAASAPQESYALFLPGGTAPSLDITVGASLALDGSNDFTGVIDDLEIYVAGENNAMDYGNFDLETDNEYIAGTLAAGGYTPGDLTGDGQVQGDGSGGTHDDVAVFLSNWNMRNLVNGSQVGDLNTRLAGDFDFDGLVGLRDWGVLRDNHANGAALNLGQLLSGNNVPEPSAVALTLLAAAAVVAAGRAKRLVALAVVLLVACVLSTTTSAAGLWNVDFQGGAGSVEFGQDGLGHPYGPDPTYGVFNIFEVESFDLDEQDMQIAFSINPSMNLVDNDGNATGLTLTVHGNVAGWNGIAGQDPLSGDHLIKLAAGEYGFETGPQAFTITGLTPSQNYVIRFDTGPGADRTMAMTIDQDGDGSLGNDTATIIPGATPLFESPILSFESDATGTFIGEYSTPDGVTGFADLAALQLKEGDFAPKLFVDRATGAMTLSNDTVSESYQLTAYSIRSDEVGALNPTNWTSIADNYDAGGDDSVDPNFDWIEFTQSADRDNLSEGQEIVSGANGALFADGSSIALGNAWIRNPTEDLTMELLIENTSGESEVVTVDVEFTGAEFAVGDFNFADGLTEADWAILKAGFSTNLSGLSLAEKYAMGDFNQDGAVNLADARLFAIAFDAQNGAGSFAAMGSNAVPEPATFSALAVGLLLLTGRQLARRRRNTTI